MATPEQITEARKTLEAKWNQEGDCASCGWHALLSEHAVEDGGSLTNLNELLDHAIRSGESEVADFIRYKIYQEEKKS